MGKAEQMFNDLDYKLTTNDHEEITYENLLYIIDFDKVDKDVIYYDNTTSEQPQVYLPKLGEKAHLAIHQQMKELKWIK